MEIFLHFDYENDDLVMKVSYEQQAHLHVVMKNTRPLNVRIPKFAGEATVTVDGQPWQTYRIGVWTHLGVVPKNATISIRYPLPADTFEETLRNGERYTLKVQGDEVVGIKPNDCPRPFYPTLH